MPSIICTDCGGSWTMADEAIQPATVNEEIIAREIQRPGWSAVEYYGICDSCRRIFRAAARQPKRRNVDDELLQIRQLVARVREAHSDWSIERCVKESVDYLNDPHTEPNSAFRAFLLDREDH